MTSGQWKRWVSSGQVFSSVVKPPTGLIEMVIISTGNIALVMLGFTLYTEPKFTAVSVESFIIGRVTSAS